MKQMYRIAVSFMMCLILTSAVIGSPSIQQINPNAKIDWTNHLYVATGQGAIPSAQEVPNRARARLKAEGYARAAAIANLLMAIKGTTISYEAIGKDYMADETIRHRIEGFVNNVEVVSTEELMYEGDKIIKVKVRAPMFGENAPGSVLLEEMVERDQQETTEAIADSNVRVILKPDAKPVKTPESTNKPAQETATTSSSIEILASTGPYTSLIIDCTGYKLDRCMSPKIRRADGSEVWGTVKADYDFVEDCGIVVYATSLAEAKKNSRSGSNPLVLKATGRAGGKFYSDPVITNADADLLLAKNAQSGFLDKYNVIFVKDGRL